jgi:hypothetical protein
MAYYGGSPDAANNGKSTTPATFAEIQSRVAALPTKSADPITSIILSIVFFAAFCANLFLVSPGVGGVPFRFIAMVGLLLFLTLLSFKAVARSLVTVRPGLLVIGYFAAVGMAISAIRGESGGALVELISTHVQAAVLLVTVAAGTRIIGARSMLWAFGLAVSLTALVSLLQWAGVRQAFDIRSLLGNVYVDVTDTALNDDRAPGLSYSTILLAQQLTLLFAAALYYNFTKKVGVRKLEWRHIILWSAALFFMCMITGNRSPILGLALFIAVMVSTRNAALFIITVPLAIGFYFLLDPLIELLGNTGLRIGETGDKSSLARSPLLQYGWRLFLNNPLGYGLTFDSKTLASTVQTADLTSYLANVRLGVGLLSRLDVHNSWLITLNVYGIFAVPVVGYCLYLGITKFRAVTLFLPYLIHISVHNAGPFVQDYMFWATLGLVLGTSAIVDDRRSAVESASV